MNKELKAQVWTKTTIDALKTLCQSICGWNSPAPLQAALMAQTRRVLPAHAPSAMPLTCISTFVTNAEAVDVRTTHLNSISMISLLSLLLIFCLLEFSEKCEVAKSHLFQHQLLDRQLLHQLSSVAHMIPSNMSAEKFIQTWPLHASLIYFLDMDPNPPPTPSKLWRIILESSGVCLATEMLYRILVWVCSKYAIDKFWQTIWSKHTVGLLAVSQANSLRKQTTGKIPSNFGTHGRSSRILLQVPLVHNHGPSLWAAREDGRKNQNSTANAWYKYLLAAEVTMVLR